MNRLVMSQKYISSIEKNLKKMSSPRNTPLNDDNKTNIINATDFLKKNKIATNSPIADGHEGIVWFVNAYSKVLPNESDRLFITFDQNNNTFSYSADFANKDVKKSDIKPQDFEKEINDAIKQFK